VEVNGKKQKRFETTTEEKGRHLTKGSHDIIGNTKLRGGWILEGFKSGPVQVTETGGMGEETWVEQGKECHQRGAIGAEQGGSTYPRGLTLNGRILKNIINITEGVETERK